MIVLENTIACSFMVIFLISGTIFTKKLHCRQEAWLLGFERQTTETLTYPLMNYTFSDHCKVFSKKNDSQIFVSNTDFHFYLPLLKEKL